MNERIFVGQSKLQILLKFITFFSGGANYTQQQQQYVQQQQQNSAVAGSGGYNPADYNAAGQYAGAGTAGEVVAQRNSYTR